MTTASMISTEWLSAAAVRARYLPLTHPPRRFMCAPSGCLSALWMVAARAFAHPMVKASKARVTWLVFDLEQAVASQKHTIAVLDRAYRREHEARRKE